MMMARNRGNSITINGVRMGGAAIEIDREEEEEGWRGSLYNEENRRTA